MSLEILNLVELKIALRLMLFVIDIYLVVQFSTDIVATGDDLGEDCANSSA